MVPIESFHNNLVMLSIHKLGTLTFKSTTMKKTKTSFPLERQDWKTGPENKSHLGFKIENNLVAYSMISIKTPCHSYSTTKLKKHTDIIQQICDNLPQIAHQSHFNHSRPQGYQLNQQTPPEGQKLPRMAILTQAHNDPCFRYSQIKPMAKNSSSLVNQNL